jgi:16S rRNA (cytosine967-C5)-methyltransferase
MTDPLPSRSTPPTPREQAAAIVGDWLRTRRLPDEALDAVERDRPFVMEVVYGVVKWRRQLDWLIRRCSHHMPERTLRAHLLAGLYELWHMRSAEPYAAVNETVAAVKRLRPSKQAGFANAVLRRVAREREGLAEELAARPLGVRLSHPDVLANRWTAWYGEARATALCEWNNRPADVILRVCLDRISARELRERLAAAGVGAEPHPFAPDRCLTLAHGVSVADLPGYAEGLFAVQDPSTLAAVDLLDPRPGDRVLDACAAPGGKTLDMAERMGGQGTLVAMDPDGERLERLAANLRRLGRGFVRVVAGEIGGAAVEGGQPEVAPESFDRVLLDVPCTNTGVLRRRPDARWRFSLERMAAVTRIQRRILNGGSAAVAPGGRLVYSTCSLEPEENERLVAGWLRHHSGFRLLAERRLFPPADGTDGGYAAVLERVRPRLTNRQQQS